MILLISVNRETLHDLEFVKPIETILKENKIDSFTRHYSKLSDADLKKSDSVIICGTSLKDFEYEKHLNKFQWIKTFEKPILGICAGMQIISIIFGAKIKNKLEIGFYKEKFLKEFFTLEGEHEVYHLHNNCVSLPKEFEEFTNSKIPQAIKHKSKQIYGVLFHPEVRNKVLIKEFVKL